MPNVIIIIDDERLSIKNDPKKDFFFWVFIFGYKDRSIFALDDIFSKKISIEIQQKMLFHSENIQKQS